MPNNKLEISVLQETEQKANKKITVTQFEGDDSYDIFKQQRINKNVIMRRSK